MRRRYILLALIALAVLAAGIYLVARRFIGSDGPAIAFTYPYVQNFDDVKLRSWYTDGGVWTIRDQALLQSVGGERPGQIHLPLNLQEDQPYHLSAFINLKRDTKAAGIAFNSQLPDLVNQQHRVYLSRPNDEELELVAGYVDEIGSFVSQARVPLPSDLSEFRFDLFVYDNTYLVQLNGQRLIDKRPLFYKNGLVGFYTIGSAIFDTMKITAADNADPGDLVYVSDFDQEPGGAGWVPFSGDWRVSDGQMTQVDANAYDTGIGYETSSFESYVVQVVLEHQQGVGAGLLFNMPSPYQMNGAHVVRYSDETDALIWGYFDAQGTFVRQGFVETEPPAEQAAYLIQVYSGENSYDVFLDDIMVARDVLLKQPQGHVGLTTSRSAAGFTSVEVFPLFGSSAASAGQLTPASTVEVELTPTVDATLTVLAETPPATIAGQALPEVTRLASSSTVIVDGSVVPYDGIFDGDLQTSEWRPLAGEWRFDNGNLVQVNPDGFDYAAVNSGQAYRDYSLQVGMTHLQDHGAGVLFNMPFADRLSGAHLVRYADRRPGAIFWGYYDDEGRFVGQGYADVPDAGQEQHTFRIISRDATYDIYLDESLIARDLPLRQNYGYVGLLTSQSAAAYDRVVVDAVDAVPLAGRGISEADGFSNMSVLGGRWSTEGDRTVQEVTEEGDYILNLGVFATEYTMEAEVTLSEESSAGAGVIFHMAEPGSRRGAHIARLVNGGSSVFWGVFDENSDFQGIGSASLESQDNIFLFRLDVTGDRMTLWVDDEPVVQDVLLDRRDGWIGLISFGGPATFESLRVNIVE